jgi:hypothetical protein
MRHEQDYYRQHEIDAALDWMERWGVPPAVQQRVEAIARGANPRQMRETIVRRTLFVDLRPMHGPGPNDLRLGELLDKIRAGEALPEPPQSEEVDRDRRAR